VFAIRRWCAILIALVLASLPATVPAAHAADCRFVLGFAALEQMIPQQVGLCLDDEQHNPANGDGLQHTTGGLLVWRKADNWTAFTDGYRTWINGPHGVQERLNSQRFPWEADAGQYPPAVSSGADFSSFVGTWVRHGFALTVNADGNGDASWRVYGWCGASPPPCDSIIGNQIIDGGHASIQLISVRGSSATGTIFGSTDPNGIADSPVTLTLLPYDMASLTETGRLPPTTTLLCGDAFAKLAPQSVLDSSPCGA
jgi:hypothetical protein